MIYPSVHSLMLSCAIDSHGMSISCWFTMTSATLQETSPLGSRWLGNPSPPPTHPSKFSIIQQSWSTGLLPVRILCIKRILAVDRKCDSWKNLAVFQNFCSQLCRICKEVLRTTSLRWTPPSTGRLLHLTPLWPLWWSLTCSPAQSTQSFWLCPTELITSPALRSTALL